MEFICKTDKTTVREIAESFFKLYKNDAEALSSDLVDKTFDIFDSESYINEHCDTIDNSSPAQFISKVNMADLDNDSITN